MTLAGLDTAAEDANSYSHRGIVVQRKWGMTHQIFFIVNTYLDQDSIMPTRAVPKAETGGESFSRPYGRKGRTAEDSSTLDIIGNS